MKQALFHGAVIEDLVEDPLPPPHPELTKYLQPPKKALKRANEAVHQCKIAFAIKKGLICLIQRKSISHFACSPKESRTTTQKRSRACSK
jgi:hypothetical protein